MNEVKNYFMYFICVSLLFLFLFFSVRIFEEKNDLYTMKLYAMINDYENINIKKEEKNININYPKFEYNVLNKKVNELISEFKEIENTTIEYSLNLEESLITMFFTINNNGNISYKNINYDIKEKEFCDNTKILDFNILGSEILSKIKTKYSTYIYETILNDNFANAFLEVKKDGIYIHFSPNILENVIHKVYIFMPSEEGTYVSDIKYDKVIAFTFDDGPSSYTKEVADTLIANDSKATFFELGNRMKYNQEAVRYLYDNKMEVASHTYAHKNLNKLSIEEIDEEINSTNIIYNEITGDNIKHVRPPYGNANETVKSRINVPIITWNVDTEDWLSRDSEKIYNHILEHAKDGDIILMHDIYPETLEAVKKVLPVLRERGFKITTITELANEKGKTLEKGHVYRSIE